MTAIEPTLATEAFDAAIECDLEDLDELLDEIL